MYINIESVLNDYINQCIPAMLRCGYHLTLAKGGPGYPHLPEQSHFAHIINGVFGLSQLMKFLVERSVYIPGLGEETFRKALALFTIHEVHKAGDYNKLDESEFSIPSERMRQEYERLGLDAFAQVDEHLMRAANVHRRSYKHGDLLMSSEAEASRLWLLVRLADTFASVKTPKEAVTSLKGYLADLGPPFVPKSPPGLYTLYYHEVKDVRGVLTNTIHQTIAQLLADGLDFFPLLYFAIGTLYLGPARLDNNANNLIPSITEGVLQSLTQDSGTNIIRDGVRRQKFDFEPYVYTFATAESLLQAVYDETLAAKPDARVALKEIDGLVNKRKELTAEWRKTIEERFGIQLLDSREHKTFNELWSQVRRYLLYVDTLLRDLNQAENRLEWFLRVFPLSSNVAENLRKEANIWARGGVGKYVLVVAYHFLRGSDFTDRSAEATLPEEVLKILHRRVLEAFRQVNIKVGQRAAVAKLGLSRDLEVYLSENLYLSFAPAIHLEADSLFDYIAPKRKGHAGQLCSLCNRRSEYTQEVRTGILDDFGRVFSNRVLPALEAPQSNRLWCPVCMLEFVLRKIAGLGLPSNAHYKNSYRIYLYVLPTFSFTPEHLRLFEPLLRAFHNVTNLPMRDYGKDIPGVPRLWLEQRELDPYWIKELMNVLDRQAAKIAKWGGRNYVGERIHTSPGRTQPHYYLIVWEKAAREQERDDTRVATRTEAWAKALFSAAILSALTSCKVYVTERPYLPIANPAELKATITLDSPPPVLRGLFGARTNEISLYGHEKGERSGLEMVLDLSAALWTVTAWLRPNKDKDIAGRLEHLNVDPLAGAYFYKEYGRENEGQSPYSPFDVACEVLLNIRGGELMNSVEKIAQKSLEIALPSGASGRGKARRYELVFREAVSAMRQAQKMIPEMREAAIGGHQPSEQSIAELKCLIAGTLLKGLERRQESRRGEIYVRAWGEDLGQLVGEFVDILVDDLYLGRAGGSFARFLRLENSLADGIYYYTDRHLREVWNEYNQQKVTRKENGQQTDE